MSTSALVRGDRVAATARNVSTLNDLVERYGPLVLAIPLDVTNRGQVVDAVVKTRDTFGRIDVVVGHGSRPALQSSVGGLCDDGVVRLLKTDTVAGLPAPVARDFVRHFAQGSSETKWGRPRLDPSYGTEAEALARLEVEGFVRSERHGSDGVDTWWENTVQGNALSMVTFTPLISRAKADDLLAGAVERARAFNDDPAKLATVVRLRVFGSYVNSDEDRLGDLDLGISVIRRRIISAQEAVDYARASGRTFPDYMHKLFWPIREPYVVVKNRSRGISLTQENPALLDGGWRDVFVADGVTLNIADDWSET
ncbi:hypothetical protein AABM26_02400 [Curtobacterium aetherium]|uniref:hypothetical protein n=1 Tax=Curtobacterium aetherium TaxID=2841594 RepID=UPI003B51A3C7